MIIRSKTNLVVILSILLLSAGGGDCAPIKRSQPLIGLFLYHQQHAFNSAFFGLKAYPQVSMSLPSFSVSLGNNAYSPQFIGDTFKDGEWLFEEDKKEILDQIQSDEISIFSRGSAGLFRMNIGTYGFSVFDYHSLARGVVPRDIMELILRGWEEGEMYLFDDVQGEAFNYGTVTFYVAKALKPPRGFDDFAISTAFKYVRGTHYWGLGRTDAYFQVLDTTINAAGLFDYWSSKSGDGIGLDLSAAGHFKPLDAYVSLVLGNLVGSIIWKDITVEELSFERHRGVDQDSMLHSDYWESFFNKFDTTYTSGSLTTGLPRFIELSVYKPAFYFGGHGDVYGGIRQSLNEAPGYSLVPGLYIGTYLTQFDKLLLCADLSVGGVEGFEIGGGIGLNLNGFMSKVYGSWQRGLFGGAKGFSVMMNNAFILDDGKRYR